MRWSVGQKARYRFDNTIARGTLPVIGYLALLTFGLVFFAAFVLAITGTAINEENTDLGEAFWQSLLRILDPGTFSGDNGWFLRIVMLIVTLIGISIAAVLIGLIASGIEQRIELMRRGRSAVIESGHTLVLGFSPRIYTVVSELCVANENQKRPAIVVLADRDKQEMEEDLASRIDDLRGTRIVVRTGSPSSLNDLKITNVAEARSVIVLGDSNSEGDGVVVKAVLAVLHSIDEAQRTPIVAEVNDTETARALQEASGGRVLTVRATDVIARITAQACRQAGLSAVCQDLLDFDGDELYFESAAPLVGRTFGDSLLAYEESCVIGVRRADGSVAVNPPMDTVFTDGDEVIALAEDDDKVRFTGLRDEVAGDVTLGPSESGPEQLLVVGWNWLGPAVLAELDQFVPPRSAVDVLVDPDLVPPEQLHDVPVQRLRVRFEAERADLDELTDTVSGRSFDHVIILGYRDGLTASEADARTLLTLLLLRRALRESAVDGSRCRIVTELLDAGDVELAQATGADDFVVSDALSSYMLTQLSENPALEPVFTDLFDAEGSAIGLKPASWYVRQNGAVSFARIVAAARARGEVALGYRTAQSEEGGPRVVMNPAKSMTVTLGPRDQVVVVGPPE
ncbi:MAG: potassium transporter TrkA [Acidimicrobiia bacterium]